MNSESKKFVNPGDGWSKSNNRVVFQMAPKITFAVPSSMHKISCNKLTHFFKTKLNIHKGLIYLEGGEQECLYDTDIETVFKQDSWFHYLFGVKESSCSGVLDIATGERLLIIPRVPTEYQLWCGKIQPLSYWKKFYDMDNVLYNDELIDWLQEVSSSSSNKKIKSSESSSSPKIHNLELYLLKGTNADSGSTCQLSAKLLGTNTGLLELCTINESEEILYYALSSVRVTKSFEELQLLQYSNYVASNAHVVRKFLCFKVYFN